MIEIRRFGLSCDPPARGAMSSDLVQRMAAQCARLGITEDTLICSGCLMPFESAIRKARKYETGTYCAICIAKRDINRTRREPKP